MAVHLSTRALVSSRLFTPPAPIAVLGVIREVDRVGTNLYTSLAVAATRWPDRTPIIGDDGALSYRELESKAESLAREPFRDGVGTGQAVGIMCRNGSDFAPTVHS
jgi:acyl-CoA synthetase (AMP-forming)/AMP-acid ligase II